MDATATRRWIDGYAGLIDRNAATLTELDAAIGDADHGTNLSRGMAAVREALDAAPADAGVAALLKVTAMTLISRVGGASGPLYGTLFLRMSTAVEDAGPNATGPGSSGLDAGGFAAAFRAGVDGLVSRGRAEKGDKTMYDALAPAADALEAAVAAGEELPAALSRAAEAAREGRDAVTPLVARKGRASYLGQRSAGHQDPGATSAVLLVEAAAAALAADA